MRALWDTTGISPWVEGFQAVNIPFLSRVPIAGTMLSGYPACIYLGLLAVAVMQYLLHRTAWGLRIRAVGENPAAVATLGINVYRPANARGASGRRFCRHGRRCHVPQLRQCVCQ